MVWCGVVCLCVYAHVCVCLGVRGCVCVYCVCVNVIVCMVVWEVHNHQTVYSCSDMLL